MAKKRTIPEESRKAILIRPADEFKKMLEERIAIGKELLKMQVTPNSTPYGGMRRYAGYVSQTERQYNAEEIGNFEKEYKKWSSYNNELLKQSFDIPDNEYQQEYNQTGILFWTGAEDVLKEYHDSINRKITFLEEMIERISLLPKAGALKGNINGSSPAQIKSNKVFIVHGHDGEVREESENLVRQLGLEPVVLFKKPNMGDTIIEKLFRESKDAAFAIILYTKCDEGKAVEESDLKPRARQNVVFEHGLMCGLLGRNKVVALVEQGVEIPGDLSGVVYISLDSNKRWHFDVAKEMKAAGLDVDLNKLI